MHVVLFTGRFLPDVGGMEYVVHYLANALVEYGIEVTVMAKQSKKPDNFDYKYRLRRYGFTMKGAYYLKLNYISAFLKLLKLQKELSINIINIHNAARPSMNALPFCSYKNIPVVITPHGQDVQCCGEYGLRLDPKWDRKIRNHLMKADAITAISDSVKNELGFIEKDKIFSIPNGIHLGTFSQEKSYYLQDLLGISRSEKIIISVGRNHFKKGYKYGIKAMNVLLKKIGMKKIKYIIVGRGVSAHKSLVQELGLRDYVYLIEEISQKNLKQCYCSSHLFFSPSTIEALSLVSIEAMACGLPLVVTNVPGNEDIVRDNQCGVIVKTQDAGDMARGIHELLTNPIKMEKLGQSALMRAKNYDWNNIAKQYCKVYKHVMR